MIQYCGLSQFFESDVNYIEFSRKRAPWFKKISFGIHLWIFLRCFFSKLQFYQKIVRLFYSYKLLIQNQKICMLQETVTQPNVYNLRDTDIFSFFFPLVFQPSTGKKAREISGDSEIWSYWSSLWRCLICTYFINF